MNQRLYLLNLIYLFSASAYYLLGQCGLTHQDQAIMKANMMRNRELARFHNQESPQGIKYVPVRFILPAKSNGSGRPNSYSDILNIPCQMSKCIQNISLEFYLKEIDTSLNYDAFFDPNLNDLFEIIDTFTKRRRDAVNIVISNSLIQSSILSTTNLANDYIIFSSLEAALLSEVLCHEVGHYFSLPHTSHGWFNEYQCSEFNNYPSNVEYVDRNKLDNQGRKSCYYTGDGFCDTPADYAQSLNPFSRPCQYQGCAIDPDGDSLTTDVNNYMYYGSTFGCARHFSFEQEQAMLNDFEFSPRKTFLHTNYLPKTILSQVSNISPSTGSILQTYKNILLDWDDLGADVIYALEYTTDKTFRNKTSILTKDSEYLLTNLEKRKKYYWRVYPMEYPGFCNFISTVFDFTTGDLINTSNIKNSKDYTIHVNKSSNELFIKNSDGILQDIKAYKMYSTIGGLVDHSNTLNTSINLNRYSSATYIFTWLDEDSNWNVGRFIKY